YHGDVVEVRTKMGRRVRCTPDHPFVTRDGLKLASDLTTEDWLPIAQGTASPAEVATFWRDRGVKADVRRGTTATTVTVSSRLSSAWWPEVLGLGRNCYEQR